MTSTKTSIERLSIFSDSFAARSAGQCCSALRVLYLQEDVADGMLKMIDGAAREMHLGNTALETTDIGPIIDREL
ncbi:aldehyde dehydrogenase family protein [Pseudochrobactrum kiredjianiae]|uniref:L-glutamate gamma-semialdehyde dehydrogenase n=1 Tax=Pseudochrobactrum kiredjianiae TaxID=386305 RepID=A0ABW3V341_9HYPH